MPRRRLWIREETRLLGAIQIMTGLIVHFVGQLWTYLFTTQVIAFGKAYLPLVVITRYTYWSSVCFLFSGVFAVLTERMRSTFLMSYTIAVNIVSACAAVIGLLIISFEFIIYSLTTQAPIWPERSGKILSEYLFLFTILELFTACTVAHWIYKAKHLR
uniref:membrane-spanning 4-domains subfamily A member 12-like isoform X2 n=1 Tax=Panthera onca TaxID=9690 RepID=UPI0029544C74|nr:membrane-spanning 4-domains subfamily A member 12-like isoform X2 [Panthera onca]